MKMAILGVALATLLGTTTAMAAKYEVTIKNITHGTIFTPILVVSHAPGVKLFTLGDPASDELVLLAEGGDVGPLAIALGGGSRVVDTADSGGPLPPGHSVTVTVDAPHGHGQVSLASMLLPTNDGFIALNGVKAPRTHRPVTYFSPGYDAGSELNDELCINIPAGGTCEAGVSNGHVSETDGVVHIHNGIHGIGELIPSDSDWRNPAAFISIKRVK